MMGAQAAAWGVFGGFAVEGLEFARAIRATRGWPWKQQNEPGPAPFVVSILIRLTVGAGLALAANGTGQISGAFGALGIGVAAPLLVEQLSRHAGGSLDPEPKPLPPGVGEQGPAMTGQGGHSHGG